ncbi:MAG: hypothetical protein HKP27_16940, partial [Myxococcales bacterium]|nr:hypothetical protein [Myxococcales bacterium]
DKQLRRVDVATGGLLSSHEIGLGTLHVHGLEILPTRSGWSAWIAASGGLVEVRVDRGAAASQPALH